MSKGLLISIEGPDGAGKTTVLEALLPRLREAYPAKVVTTREPGGVAIAEQIREVILDVDNTAMDARQSFCSILRLAVNIWLRRFCQSLKRVIWSLWIVLLIHQLPIKGLVVA